jgi:hypothetical protein
LGIEDGPGCTGKDAGIATKQSLAVLVTGSIGQLVQLVPPPRPAQQMLLL